MKKLILFFIGIICNVLSYGQTKYCDKIDNEIIVKKTYLTISYSTSNKIANYVGYYIVPSNLKSNYKRETVFYPESLIPYKYRAKSSDYTGTGYDRGHMSPAADWTFNKTAMHESFSLVNICPQRPDLNRKYWKDIEEYERECAMICDTVYVISGSICNGTPKYIKNKVRIPDKFYKTCIGIQNNQVVLSIGWIMDNNNSKQLMRNCKTTIDEIETKINKDLYIGFWFNNKFENKILER